MLNPHEVEALQSRPAVEQATIDLPIDDTETEPSDAVCVRLVVDELNQTADFVIERGMGSQPSLESLLALLRTHEVVYGVDQSALEALCAKIKSGEGEIGERVCVARSLAPISPKPSAFELVMPNADETRSVAAEDSNGRVDFREIQTIVVVDEGELVARIIPGEEGVNGIGLNGESICFEECDETNSQTLGQGVEVSACGSKVFATRHGRPILLDGELSVLQVFEVEGDVDFSTGNIRFDGHVVVRGSVLDEFELECRSLEVHGTVGASTVFCSADASLLGGVNGNGKCRLFIGGDCDAKYLNQVIAHIGGSLDVERGITNSQIVCWGQMSANRVVGGKSAARLGYLIEDLGSELGVVTVVAPGLISLPSYGQKTLEELDDVPERSHLDESTVQGSDSGATPAVNTSESQDRMVDSIRLALLERFTSEPAANDDEEVCLEERVFMVNVTSRMHADVIVCGENRCREFVEKSAGKMSIQLDEATGNYEKGPFRRLRVVTV